MEYSKQDETVHEHITLMLTTVCMSFRDVAWIDERSPFFWCLLD